MQVCKKCGCGNFSGEMVHVKRLFPHEDEISYSRWVAKCSNGHLIGAFDKPQNLAELKTHHTTTQGV